MDENSARIKEPIELNSKALMLRDQLGEDRFSPVQIFSLVSKIENVSLVYYPMSINISGVCVRAGDEKLIVINSTLTNGRQRFTAAHELYHLYEQDGFKNVVCPSNIGDSKEPEEINADNFASYFLAPFEALRLFIFETLHKEKQTLTLNDVIAIEQFFGMSHKATLFRLYKERLISQKQRVELLRESVIAAARELGYDTDLYQRDKPDQAKRRSLGSYINLTKALLDSGIISCGKADEYLIAAFREDIVFQRDRKAVEEYD